MLAARVVQGMGAAASRVLAAAIVRDRFEGREMARVMSLTMMVFIIVPVVAPAIGSFFLLFGSWHFIFLSTFVVGLALAVWFGTRMPETLRPEYRLTFSMRRIYAGFRQTVTTRVSFGYTTCAALVMGSLMAYVGGAQQILETDVYGLGPLFPVAFGCIAASMGVGALINSKLVRRYGMRRLSHGAICMCIFMAALQIGLAVMFDGRPPLILFCGGVALIHFFFSLTLPNFNAMALQPLGAIAGTASSFVGFFTTVIGAICGLVIGQAFDGTVLPLVTGFFVLNTAGLLVILWTERGRLFTPQNPDPVH
jgi:DHA1 family bicyclomycin/chloramphenicol resistance-like MFS transporter